MIGRFDTTSWTLVLTAREEDSTVSREALARLCQAYWTPLYAFVRRRGYGPDEARDLTQAYFAELLEKDYLDQANPDAGRFRSFLLASLSHLLAHEEEKARALKRGAGRKPLALDLTDAERHYQVGTDDNPTPEELFEKRWALTVLQRVLDRLSEEFVAEGRGYQFERLQGFLTGESPAVPYRQIGEELEMSEAAVKKAVQRLRRRFGRGLRAEIAETVSAPDQVDEEVKHLLQVLMS